MSERSDRLARARREAKFASRSAVYERFPDWSKNSYKSHENGAAPYSFVQAKVYAKAFGVRAEWLYDGKLPIRPDVGGADDAVEVPLVSWVSAGELLDVPADAIADAERVILQADLPRGDYIAFRVEGNSMDRWSPPGSIIIVNRSETEPLEGRPYVFVTETGEATYKRWQSDPDRLVPYSTDPNIETVFPRGDFRVLGRVRRTILDLDRA